METKSNKKTITIVVIVLAVVVIGSGAYYGYNRWHQQRILNDYYQALYGTNAPGMMAGLLGGATTGGLSADAINELAKLQAEEDAKQEAEDAANEKEEAAKTPEDKFNEAEAAYLTSSVSPLFDQVAKANVEAIYGKYKIIASTIGYYGTAGFAVQVMVPEKITAESFDKLTQKFVEQGYVSSYGEIENSTGIMMLGKDDGTTITLSFDTDSDEQGITIMYAVSE